MNSNELMPKVVELLEKILDKLDKMLNIAIEEKDSETYDGIIETFEVTATTQFKTLWPPINKEGKRPKWLWVQFVNDSDTTDAYCGVNVGNVNALKVVAGETHRIGFGNKKVIEYANYKTLTGTADLRIIFAR